MVSHIVPDTPATPIKNDVSPYLGNTTESASPPLNLRQVQSRLIWRYRIQSEARRLLNNFQHGVPHRISCCMRCLAYGKDRVEIQKHEVKARARFRGLMKCDSVWVCPVCSSVITERRKDELHLAVDAAKHLGLEMFMVTYTLRHAAGDDLRQTLETLLNAYRYARAGAPGMRIRKRYGIRGSIKALEVTHGESGWHPHLHEILFLNGDTVHKFTRIDLENTLRDRWQDQVERFGGDVIREIGVRVDRGDSYVAEYVAKFGHEPKETRWSIEAEVAKSPVKTARSKDGRTPFALLEDSMNGDEPAGRLFIDYAHAFKGRAQLIWSPGLAALLGVDVLKDPEANEESETQKYFTLAFIEREDWFRVLRQDVRGELLEVASEGDIEKLRAFILNLYDSEIEF